MSKTILNRPLFLHYLKILTLYFSGYHLASHYRPFQNRQDFFDFGLADSGVGLVSIIIVYLIFTPPGKSQNQAINNSYKVLFAYLSQEIYCYFFPGFVGTFDFKDLIYYILGFILAYQFDAKGRPVI